MGDKSEDANMAVAIAAGNRERVLVVDDEACQSPRRSSRAGYSSRSGGSQGFIRYLSRPRVLMQVTAASVSA